MCIKWIWYVCTGMFEETTFVNKVTTELRIGWVEVSCCFHGILHRSPIYSFLFLGCGGTDIELCEPISERRRLDRGPILTPHQSVTTTELNEEQQHLQQQTCHTKSKHTRTPHVSNSKRQWAVGMKMSHTSLAYARGTVQYAKTRETDCCS